MRTLVPWLPAFAALAVIFPTVASDAPVPNTVLSRYRMTEAQVRSLESSAIEFQVETRHTDARSRVTYDVLVPQAAVKRTAFAEIPGQLIEADTRNDVLRVPAATRASYHDYPAVKEHLERLERENPDILQVEIYGQSKEGRDLYAVHLATPLAAANFRPGLLLTGGTHGDELIGVETLFHVLEQTLAGLKSGDPVIRAALDKFTLYFVPVVNADGFARRDRLANGIDPNRDYPYPSQPSKKSNAAIEAMMDFTVRHNIVGAIDWHAYGSVVGYPWSYQRQQVSNSADREAFVRLAASMGRAAGYQYGQIPNVLYIAQGTSGDWFYWQRHAMAFVIEIGNQKIPQTSTWPQRFRENLAAYKAFLTGMVEAQKAEDGDVRPPAVAWSWPR